MQIPVIYRPSGARALWRNELVLDSPIFDFKTCRRVWKWRVGGEEYPHLFDKPWDIHPDAYTPINDLPADGKVFEEVPF